jgi:hypothetical protein
MIVARYEVPGQQSKAGFRAVTGDRTLRNLVLQYKHGNKEGSIVPGGTYRSFKTQPTTKVVGYFHSVPAGPTLNRHKTDRRTYKSAEVFALSSLGALPYSGGRARGSRSLVPESVGAVTNGPPASGATALNATSGISLGFPSNGKSFRNGK